MNLFKLFFITFLGALLFISCEKDINPVENSTQLDCIGFSKDDLAKVGVLHNEYLIEVYQNVDFRKCTNCIEDILIEFRKLDIDLTDYDKTQDEVVMEANLLYQELEAIEYDLRKLPKNPISAEAHEYMTAILDVGHEIKNYQDYLTEMNSLQTVLEKDASLSCFDVELLTSSIEIAKNSAYLWMPKDMGGLDFYLISHPADAMTESFEKDDYDNWCWTSAVGADITAGASYFLSNAVLWGVGIIAPPVGFGVLFVWGLSTSISSAIVGVTGSGGPV